MRPDRSLEPEIVAHDPLVAMFTAPNPGPKTLDGTNTFVVAHGEVYIIDPGPEIPGYQQLIVEWILRLRRGPTVNGILLTHGHPDHAPGALALASTLGAPIYASARLDRQFFRQDPAIRPIGQGYVFAVGRYALHTLEAPGHSLDHLAFWLEDSRVLFSGDTVLGRGTSLVAPPEGNMRQYMQTLSRFQQLDPRVICPGHGPVIRQPAVTLKEYVEHREERERQVLAALADGPASARELVARLYADVDPRLHELALGSVLAQLQKLQEEGRARRTGERYTLAGSGPSVR
jgi:glyoxylase-like metal-dependent hydrolase (beta-lactamase superfamily II)